MHPSFGLRPGFFATCPRTSRTKSEEPTKPPGKTSPTRPFSFVASQDCLALRRTSPREATETVPPPCPRKSKARQQASSRGAGKTLPSPGDPSAKASMSVHATEPEPLASTPSNACAKEAATATNLASWSLPSATCSKAVRVRLPLQRSKRVWKSLRKSLASTSSTSRATAKRAILWRLGAEAYACTAEVTPLSKGSGTGFPAATVANAQGCFNAAEAEGREDAPCRRSRPRRSRASRETHDQLDFEKYCFCVWSVSFGEGKAPTSMAWRTTPNDHMSPRSAKPAGTCEVFASGDINWGVPPSGVKLEPLQCASPKSMSFMAATWGGNLPRSGSRAEKRKCSGLRSR
mmetsp:Transcript_63394/g.136366  ORF Transcript_63394/g.136366 Transcript_63394/m.136366 type:complete len:347 (+) Transcript_63394:181-1221(+)